MRFWHRFSPLAQTIIKRMLAQPWLTLATFVGLVISIALTVSI